MKEKVLVIIRTLVITMIISVIFIVAGDFKIKKSGIKDASLIIYGDTIASGYNPFVEDDKVYLSFDTVKKFIDEDIFFDSVNEKIIVTTQDELYKFTLGKNIATKNLEQYDAKSCCKMVNNSAYIDIGLVKEIYNIKCEYDEETSTISIDKLDTSDIHLNYNQVKLYSGLSTKSEILDTLNIDNTVTVYTESLKHNRWYKVKSDSGKIGYIEKKAVTLNKEEEKKEQENDNDNQEKLIMFWQYGSNLTTLGDKIDCVNVVMPTWYAVSDSDGSVEINYSKEYYNKAKEYGYDIWPIITNGIDNPDLNTKQVTSQIMRDEQKRENLIRNIIDIINTNELDGINIDFESMDAEDKYLYTQFLRELYPMVKKTGAKLSVDIYFTNYIDRMGVGKACDYVILMGYDQRGNWSNEAGSISEISWVEKNVASLINDSKIPSNKIILGVPFYTRLWKEESDGTLTTNTYSMNNSQEFLSKYNLTPSMDNISGQNYVAIELGNTMYKLWIEDVQSMEKRANTVLEYELAGISAWQKGFETEDIWQMFELKLKEK